MYNKSLNTSSGSYNTKKRAIQNIDNGAAVTRTLTDAESGTLYLVDMSTVDKNVAITLPTASGSEGVWFDFCFTVNCDDDADFSVTTGADGTDIYGYIVCGAANSTVDDVDGLSKLTIDGSVAQSTEGLRLTFLCDGTNWHLSGYNPTAIGTVLVVEAASA